MNHNEVHNEVDGKNIEYEDQTYKNIKSNDMLLYTINKGYTVFLYC